MRVRVWTSDHTRSANIHGQGLESWSPSPLRPRSRDKGLSTASDRQQRIRGARSRTLVTVLGLEREANKQGLRKDHHRRESSVRPPSDVRTGDRHDPGGVADRSPLSCSSLRQPGAHGTSHPGYESAPRERRKNHSGAGSGYPTRHEAPQVDRCRLRTLAIAHLEDSVRREVGRRLVLSARGVYNRANLTREDC